MIRNVRFLKNWSYANAIILLTNCAISLGLSTQTIALVGMLSCVVQLLLSNRCHKLRMDKLRSDFCVTKEQMKGGMK